MRLLPGVLLCLVPMAGVAQVDPVWHGVVVVLHDHGCKITDAEARSAFEARGLAWEDVIAEMRRMVEAGEAYVTDGGRTFGIGPPLCEPEPVVVPYDGPDHAGWITGRLAPEEDCRMPLARLREEGLAAGLEPGRFDEVIGYMDMSDTLRREGEDVRLSPLRCAMARDPYHPELLAIAVSPIWDYDRELARVLEGRGCRMFWSDPEAGVAGLAEALVGPLDLDRSPAGMEAVAREVLERLVAEALMAHPERFAVDTATQELVLRDCGG